MNDGKKSDEEAGEALVKSLGEQLSKALGKRVVLVKVEPAPQAGVLPPCPCFTYARKATDSVIDERTIKIVREGIAVMFPSDDADEWRPCAEAHAYVLGAIMAAWASELIPIEGRRLVAAGQADGYAKPHEDDWRSGLKDMLADALAHAVARIEQAHAQARKAAAQ